MRKFHTLKGGKEQSYNPKLTAARVALAKTESEIEKLLDTLSGANPLLLQYANTRIEELDAERQKQLRLVADLTANSVSASQIDSITGYLDDWESVSFDDKRKVVDKAPHLLFSISYCLTNGVQFRRENFRYKRLFRTGWYKIEENDSFEDSVSDCVRKVVKELLKKETQLLKQMEKAERTEA